MTLVNHCPDCHMSFKEDVCPSCGNKFIPLKQIVEGFAFSHFVKIFRFDDDGFLRLDYNVFACQKDYEKFHSPDCVKVRITVEVIEDV